VLGWEAASHPRRGLREYALFPQAEAAFELKWQMGSSQLPGSLAEPVVGHNQSKERVGT
jgi:hypothetical protein